MKHRYIALLCLGLFALGIAIAQVTDIIDIGTIFLDQPDRYYCEPTDTYHDDDKAECPNELVSIQGNETISLYKIPSSRQSNMRIEREIKVESYRQSEDMFLSLNVTQINGVIHAIASYSCGETFLGSNSLDVSETGLSELSFSHSELRNGCTIKIETIVEGTSTFDTELSAYPRGNKE